MEDFVDSYMAHETLSSESSSPAETRSETPAPTEDAPPTASPTTSTSTDPTSFESSDDRSSHDDDRSSRDDDRSSRPSEASRSNDSASSGWFSWLPSLWGSSPSSEPSAPEPRPQPPPVTVSTMPNAPLFNVPSGINQALGLRDQRVQDTADHRLDVHRQDPATHVVYDGHSNGSQTAHTANTHEELTRAQARRDSISEDAARDSEQHQQERQQMLNQTHIVSLGGPRTRTDVPDANRDMIRHVDDIVPQVPTYDSLTGRATTPNERVLGPSQLPPVPEPETLVDTDPERTTANLMNAVGTGVRMHTYDTVYQQSSEETTQRRVQDLQQQGHPVHVRVAEGWGGTDADAARRTEQIRSAVNDGSTTPRDDGNNA